MFLNRKRPTTFIANIAGMNPLKFFIESIGRVFQTLKKYQKRKKRKKNTKFFQGFSSPNHLPISSPGSLFFSNNAAVSNGFARPGLRHQTSPSSLGFLEGASNLSSCLPRGESGINLLLGRHFLSDLFGMVK